jgi:hypothetical protein
MTPLNPADFAHGRTHLSFMSDRLPGDMSGTLMPPASGGQAHYGEASVARASRPWV